MKRRFLFCISVLLLASAAQAQTSTNATVSYVLGEGNNMTNCTPILSHGHYTSDSTEQQGFMAMEYYPNSDSLANASWAGSGCYPTFPSYANVVSGSGPVQVYNSHIAYDPATHMEYFFTYVDTLHNTETNTYMFEWPVGTCPTGTLQPIAEFPNTYLLAVFDPAGNLWGINLIPNGSGAYNMTLQQIYVVGHTATLGNANPIAVTGGPAITSQNGDDLFTPDGNLFYIINNEDFAIGYQAYNPASTTNTVIGTYIANTSVGSGNYVDGTAYASGTIVGAVYTNGVSCAPIYDDVNLVTAGTTPIKYAGGFNSTDNTSVTSGVGAAKNLISVTPTGVSGQYTVVYDVYVINYGNYPVANIQATDNLANITKSAANVVSVSTSWVKAPLPSDGVSLNASYNGTTNDSLFSGLGTLPNNPTSADTLEVQISVTLNNIQSGTIYYNAAVAYGNGLYGDRLTDTSTNGTNPNPDGSGRPDDPGEDIPTPFLITITPTSVPCTTLPTMLFTETFGAGSSSLTTSLPAGGTTQYTGVTTAPLGTNDYTVTKNANNGNTADYVHLADHTTGTGDMMLVQPNVLPDIVYQVKMNNLCPNLKYSFNAYVAAIDDSAEVTFCNAVTGYQPPNLTFQLYDSAAGIGIASLNTGPIWDTSWTSYGIREPLPVESTGQVELQIINNGGGSCGGAFALDDIQFGLCDPLPTVTVDGTHAGCLGDTTMLSATLLDTTVFGSDTLVYQWQDSIPGSGVWSNSMPPDVTGSLTDTLVINPVTTTNSNIYYRVNVAAEGFSLSATCSYFSPSFLIAPKAPSTAPTSITASPTTTEPCAEVPITLTEVGGVLGNGGAYYWYQGGCGTGTSIGTGNSITVEPTVTTAYFVQAQGACNTTTCAAVGITVACALPTDLIYFNGTYASGITTLTWAVTDNENLEGFYVERSIDGVNFTTIDSVAAAQESGQVNYNYEDNVSSIHVQTITYRIVLHFKTGDLEPSSIVAISKPLDLASGLIVYPNPTSGQLTIAVTSDKEQVLTYNLISIEGQMIVTGSQTLSRGANSVNVNGLQLVSSGTYILRIQTEDYITQKKVIIQK